MEGMEKCWHVHHRLLKGKFENKSNRSLVLIVQQALCHPIQINATHKLKPKTISPQNRTITHKYASRNHFTYNIWTWIVLQENGDMKDILWSLDVRINTINWSLFLYANETFDWSAKPAKTKWMYSAIWFEQAIGIGIAPWLVCSAPSRIHDSTRTFVTESAKAPGRTFVIWGGE